MVVLLMSLMLFGLVVGTLCLGGAGNKSAYVASQTTYWVYAAISFAIGVVALLVMLYLAYAWSCACMKRASPCATPPRRGRSSSACAPPPSCY